MLIPCTVLKIGPRVKGLWGGPRQVLGCGPGVGQILYRPGWPWDSKQFSGLGRAGSKNFDNGSGGA
jgi:hypothetical protein